MISFLLISLLPIATSNAATKAQLSKPLRAGRIASVGANTILNGVTAPKASEGIEGDFYINTKAMLFYGPKTKTSWPSPISIRGPKGQVGPNGSNGTDAKPGAHVIAAGAQGLTGATGPKGEQGTQGIQGVAGPAGSKGEAGATGAAGSSGASGSIGATGSSGPQGSVGSQGANGNSGANGSVGPAGPSGAVGATGATGATGSIGATGSSGPQGSVGSQGANGNSGANGSVGPAGPPGAVGATGPSNAIYGPISFVFPIQGVVGTAQTSSNFGTFEAGKSYIVRIQIQTFNIDGLSSGYPLTLDVVTQGASPTRSVSYVVSNGSSFELSTIRHDVSITAEVILDGSQVAASYALSVTLTCGINTTPFPLTLMGRYHAVVVGQVTQTS
jgi:hypothetical protein